MHALGIFCCNLCFLVVFLHNLAKKKIALVKFLGLLPGLNVESTFIDGALLQCPYIIFNFFVNPLKRYIREATKMYEFFLSILRVAMLQQLYMCVRYKM